MVSNGFERFRTSDGSGAYSMGEVSLEQHNNMYAKRIVAEKWRKAQMKNQMKLTTKNETK